MKCLFFLCLFAPAYALAQSGPADSTKIALNLELDKRYSFLGNKFDTPLSNFKGLVFIENYNGEKVYKRVGDIKQYGQAKIAYIHYIFYKGLLSGVQVFAPNNYHNNQAWRDMLKAAYGVARDSSLSESPTNYGGNYLWTGHNAGINYSSYLGRNISVYAYSMKAVRRKEKDAEQALKKAAQGL